MRREPTDDLAKPRADATLKNLPDELMEELWQYTRRNTYKATIVWLKETHDVEVASTGTLKEFYHWYPKTRTLRRAARAASRLEETLPKIASLKLSAAQAREIAQAEFELQASEDQDRELFAMLSKGERERERLRLDREKFEHSKKTDIERGLDALFAEIEGDAEAERLYAPLADYLRKKKGRKS